MWRNDRLNNSDLLIDTGKGVINLSAKQEVRSEK